MLGIIRIRRWREYADHYRKQLNQSPTSYQISRAELRKVYMDPSKLDAEHTRSTFRIIRTPLMNNMLSLEDRERLSRQQTVIQRPIQRNI
ncbi:unnamed protein product [Acanthoscelides obtectus]|uniref:Uncharacterized protein n=1 Tax=Acanthoscelides obtectus TaxID=200917 RepID=A0A9P0P066_ACAOB|nr:unnamed protein product [Acanthoscelides obtectus]CAK1631595.1 hypothetical protein AOBTE_LOCUS7030 [Acanthoscelides obtectus]